MKNKKGILTVLAGAAVLLTACGTLSGSQSAVKKNGVLRIGMEGDWMPWNFHNEAGELIGYDTDIARNIAINTNRETGGLPTLNRVYIRPLVFTRYTTCLSGISAKQLTLNINLSLWQIRIVDRTCVCTCAFII